jgi:hypothetical protein
MNTEQGCVILFTDRRTGSERYGCLDEDAPPWTMNQPTPTIKLVKTLDEAKLSPFSMKLSRRRERRDLQTCIRV